MDQSETPQQLRRLRHSLAWSLCACVCASLFACNVYDSSLLQAGLSSGGNGNNSGGSSTTGGAGNVAGASGLGGSGAVAGAGQTGGGGTHVDMGEAGMAGVDTGGSSSTTGGSGGSGGVESGAGAGGLVQVGGNSNGGSVSTGSSVIDDMEDQDRYISKIDGRVGAWYLAPCKGGTQTPASNVVPYMSGISGGRSGSLFALHSTAATCSGGALVGLDLNNKSARLVYDASKYSGVHFWAKVASSSPTGVKFAMPDTHTDPMGGQCDKVTDAGQCYDHFATSFVFTTEWKEYTAMFVDLSQVGWGNNKVDSLDVKNVYGIELSWITPAMDLWIDDIVFLNKG